MKKKFLYIYFALCSALLFSRTALAYIDPSAMTYIIQIVAGIAITAGAAFGFYIRKIKRGLGKIFHKKESAVVDYGTIDDDETGLGDYDIPEEYLAAASPEVRAIFCAEPAAETSPGTDDVGFIGGVAASPVFDKYDECGGESYLEAENRELRRLLAIERKRAASSGGGQ